MLFGLNDDEPLPDLSGVPPKLLRELGELAAPRGTYFDAFPIDLLTTSSMRHFQRQLPEDVALDVRRFRPNFLVDDGGGSDAMRERDWVGRSLRLGHAGLDVVMECPRCTIIAAEQAGGIRRDARITRTIVRTMRQCISVYCNVRQPGRVTVGDELTV